MLTQPSLASSAHPSCQVLVLHELKLAESAGEVPVEQTRRPGALWTDRMAFRVWLGCGFLLWLLGFVNLVTGVARR